MKFYNLPEVHFNLQQYLLGDSAFENQWFLVSAYKKKPNGTQIPHEYELFNTCMLKPCVISEHCIGHLKGRFLWLHKIWTVIKGKEDLKRILFYIDVCVILHDRLVDATAPDEWDLDDNFTQCNACTTFC
jgi:DDE superfamily endonuclease